MATSNNHSELLKAAKKAVNSFVFAPSLEKQEIVFDKSKSKSSRKAEIEAVLTSGKKLKRSERSVLNKELHALLSEEREAARKLSKSDRAEGSEEAANESYSPSRRVT